MHPFPPINSLVLSAIPPLPCRPFVRSSRDEAHRSDPRSPPAARPRLRRRAGGAHPPDHRHDPGCIAGAGGARACAEEGDSQLQHHGDCDGWRWTRMRWRSTSTAGSATSSTSAGAFELGATGTYIGEILAERDSALARWPDRMTQPLRVWVGNGPHDPRLGQQLSPIACATPSTSGRGSAFR